MLAGQNVYKIEHPPRSHGPGLPSAQSVSPFQSYIPHSVNNLQFQSHNTSPQLGQVKPETQNVIAFSDALRGSIPSNYGWTGWRTNHYSRHSSLRRTHIPLYLLRGGEHDDLSNQPP